MSTFTAKLMIPLIAGALYACMASSSPAHADTEYKQTISVNPQGSIEIIAISGSIEIDGWDRPEVEITGTPDGLSDRVRLSSSEDHTTIHVEPYSLHSDAGGDVHLVVHVPAQSSVATSLVNASVEVKGLKGDTYLRSIGGSVGGEVNGNLRVNTVTGAVHVSARSAQRIEIRTMSGRVDLAGGSGEAEVSTVSGKIQADLGSLSRGRFKSISGNITANYSLADNGQIEGESVSGTIRFGFASSPSADIDVESLSGTIDSCFGPKPTESRYGPGSKLIFKSGEGHGSLRITTQSGDVNLCTGTAHAG
jgi:DUF4097 and DUF4098 domain-containing protein YvlB